MRGSVKEATAKAVLRLLDPLVRLLLKAGIGVGDLMTVVKVAYVSDLPAFFGPPIAWG